MWNKLKNDDFAKSLFKKIIICILIAAIALLTFDVLKTGKDGRRQIVDPDGGSEYTDPEISAFAKEEERLTSILEDIQNVGEVKVMITEKNNSLDTQAVSSSVFDEPENKNYNEKVEGVIVTAEGAQNAVVKNDIESAVSALYGIPSTRIMVYEKEGGKSK